MNTNTPLINGTMYSWASITTNIMGVPVIGITKISYKESQEVEAQMGAGSKPVGVTFGDSKFEGSITLFADEVDKLEDLSKTGRLQDIPAFPIVVAFAAGGKVKTHRLMYCIFKENSRSGSTGDKKLEVELPLFIGDIKWK